MIDKIRTLIGKYKDLAQYDIGIAVSEENIVTLTGEVDVWQHVVDIGHLAGSLPEVYSVVNNIAVKGLTITAPDHTAESEKAKKTGVITNTDVLIIGAGVSGCAIARALSKYRMKVTLTDMHNDVCMGASKANSGAIHPGHMAKPGTLKARLNVKGNAMYNDWAKELNFNMKKRGSMGVAYDEREATILKKLYQMAKMNGVPDIRLIDGDEALRLEPNLQGQPVVALYNGTMGSVEPYEIVIAVADSAALNGVKFILGNPVYDIVKNGDRCFDVITKKGIIRAGYVVNAAGVHADDIAEMAGDKFYTIHARRGTILVFDKAVKYPYSRGVGTIPNNATAESKGGGCGVTPEGNIHAGPSATETPYKDSTETDPEDFRYSMRRANNMRKLKPTDLITFFTGVRAADYKEDFIIGMSKKAEGFIHVAGIQSPGFTAAPAVAEMVENIILENSEKHGITVERNPAYNPYLAPKVRFRHMSREERDALIKRNPKYGRVICRCETITEGEILDAIHSPIVPASVDAIKRRTRAGMGRCQGGFCQQKVVEILARELGQEWVDINLKDEGSYILKDANRKDDRAPKGRNGVMEA